MKIRPVEKSDLKVLCSLIFELADYEKLTDICKITETDLERIFFTNQENSPKGFICDENGTAVGYIITFFNFSSFHGRKGLYLEDLYVKPEYRGRGFGKQALAFLADFAVQNNCTRFEWSVLNWNTPAIEFYKSLGAEAMSGWTVYRLEGERLRNLASQKT